MRSWAHLADADLQANPEWLVLAEASLPIVSLLAIQTRHSDFP
jgi:hypothetical protein